MDEDTAIYKLALLDLVLKHPERILVICTKCQTPRRPNEIVLRRKPEKAEYHFRAECKKCESKRVTQYSKTT